MKHMIVILNIVEGVVNNDLAAARDFSHLLALRLAAEGEVKGAERILKVLRERPESKDNQGDEHADEKG